MGMALAFTHFPQAVSDSVMGCISGLRSLPELWPPCRQTPSSDSHQQRVCAGCVTGLEGQACRLLGDPGVATGGAAGRGRTASGNGI